MKRKFLAAAAALASMVCGLAHASGSDLSVTSLAFTLHDLDPTDDVRLAVFDERDDTSIVGIVDGYYAPGPGLAGVAFITAGPSWFYDQQGHGAVGYGAMSFGAVDNGPLGYGRAGTASLFTDAVFSNDQVWVEASSFGTFVLSPHTSIEFSGSFLGSVRGIGSASAYACLAQSCSDEFITSGPKKTGSFDLFFANNSDEYEMFTASFYAQASISAVPEPTTAFLIAAGLIPLAARRKLKRA